MRTVPTASPDERALVVAARAGDERAFRTLVEPYRRPLELHCYRMLGSPARRRGRGAGGAAARLAGPRPLRAAGLGADVALPHRDQRVPRRARASAAHAGRRAAVPRRASGAAGARGHRPRHALRPARGHGAGLPDGHPAAAGPPARGADPARRAGLDRARDGRAAAVDGRRRQQRAAAGARRRGARRGRGPVADAARGLAAGAAPPLRGRLGPRRRARPRGPAARGRRAADAAAAVPGGRRGDRALPGRGVLPLRAPRARCVRPSPTAGPAW